MATPFTNAMLSVADDAHARLREHLSRALEGRFRVRELLGEGGMGAVFLADDLERNRSVAIKVLPPRVAHDASVVERFHREARTAASLDHPGIVRVLDEGNADGLHYFVMQYIAGQSLEQLLGEHSTAPIALVTRVLCEAAAALAHAHQRDVVHRDVKPANMMLDSSGSVVLTDFGISKIARSASAATTALRLTQTGGVVGTPHYMAPENALGRPLDGRADQYALAVVGFRMLAGRVPFDDETGPAIIHLQINAAAPRLELLRPDVPPHLAAALARAMSKAPSHRFETMEQFAEAVAGPPRAYGSFGRRAAVAAALVIAGGLAAGAWWKYRVPAVDDAGRSASAVAAPAAVKQKAVRLSVTSMPGATLFIDGRRIGTTPVVDHSLSAGRHVIRLEHKGYRTRRDTINVAGAAAVRRTYTLRREGR